MVFGERRPKGTKSVLNIKTLMTGNTSTSAKYAAPGESPTSKRSLQVLVNEGPSAKETSIEFTTLDPTEKTDSFTSIDSTTGELEGSFAKPCEGFDSDQDDDFNDPYLTAEYHFNRRSTSQKENEWCTSAREMNSDNNDKNNKGEDSPLTNKLITFTKQTENITESLDDPDKTVAAPPKAILKSLGTFDFPTTDTPAAPVIGPIKSLGSGCFEIPPKEPAPEAASPKTNSTAEGFSLATPLSAIGKSLLSFGSLALPRALQFDLSARQQPPSTPVSQTEPVENPQKTKRMTQHQMIAERECERWDEVVTKHIQVYGKNSIKTADALLQLGQAYMHAGEYAQAVVTFQSACRIWNRMEKTKADQLAFARVVDSIGMAWSRVTQDEDTEHCHKAMAALEEAFQIRYELLGPWHPDCVETLNKIASVHLHLREYSEACNAYFEVFHVRQAIFGKDHPSVAVAAHALGNVLLKLADTEDAANFFQTAADIYERMNLSTKHPAVTRLMRDYKRLDRICLTSRLPMQPLPSHRSHG